MLKFKVWCFYDKQKYDFNFFVNCFQKIEKNLSKNSKEQTIYQKLFFDISLEYIWGNTVKNILLL